MLTLTIKRPWFNMIVGGAKKEEYREVKPYYDSRFMNLFGAIWADGKLLQGEDVPEEIRKDPIQEIVFRNGYSRNDQEIRTRCRLAYGEGRQEWGAEPGKKYYILKIEEVVGDGKE